MSKKSSGPFVQPVRRSQDERSATTRAQILRATTEILFSEGYAAATVQLIASRAGVSRGAMLHHFPSKVDLMVAVVRFAHEADTAYLREHLDRIDSPLDRITTLPQLIWKVLSGPSGIAVLEIMLGSRSDRDLAQSLEPVQTQIEAESRERVAELMRSAGVQVDAESRELAGLVVAAIRGLSIEAMFRKGSCETPAALHVLQSLIQVRFLPQALPSQTDSRALSRGPTPSHPNRKTRL